jgi:SAM-dependent methyltransferase
MDYEYGEVLKTISKWYSKASRVLDFGSGKGNFLFLAKKFGFDVLGIETAMERAEFAKQKFQLNISEEMYSEGKIGEGSFDVITLFHVLEHLPNPKEILSNLVKGNLAEKGLLILEVPNFSSLQSSIAKNRWMHLDIPRHLSHFTDKKLIQLTRELNFKVIKTEYFSVHLGVLGMCHTILSVFGYKGKIIKDLKHYNLKLVFGLLLILPLAFVLELVSSVFNRGGIVRLYCQKN